MVIIVHIHIHQGITRRTWIRIIFHEVTEISKNNIQTAVKNITRQRML